MESASAKIGITKRGRPRAQRPDPARLSAARARLDSEGKTFADWARENGFAVDTVQKVLSGTRPCTTGAQHEVAVALGIKDPPLPRKNLASDGLEGACR
ncbi:hypothetical protein K9B35_14375 [Sphingomonas sp. R647]|uniref:hypothetical protein n=1 Tax=Sphingomonas sp. R647 TaxID=2875233 RepID=UPI001CD2AD78|nr:hypothetical protein [Sphingomonas sp. R647]MCA1199160.1 hypothetical protein [Sphingomonas sp. R647]